MHNIVDTVQFTHAYAHCTSSFSAKIPAFSCKNHAFFEAFLCDSE